MKHKNLEFVKLYIKYYDRTTPVRCCAWFRLFKPNYTLCITGFESFKAENKMLKNFLFFKIADIILHQNIHDLFEESFALSRKQESSI